MEAPLRAAGWVRSQRDKPGTQAGPCSHLACFNWFICPVPTLKSATALHPLISAVPQGLHITPSAPPPSPDGCSGGAPLSVTPYKTIFHPPTGGCSSGAALWRHRVGFAGQVSGAWPLHCLCRCPAAPPRKNKRGWGRPLGPSCVGCPLFLSYGGGCSAAPSPSPPPQPQDGAQI